MEIVWIILAIVAVIVIAGLVIGMKPGGRNGKGDDR